MNFMFVVNDIDFGITLVTAETIVSSLFDRRRWVFAASSANLWRINKGDQVVIYMAGRGRRYFIASFEVAKAPSKEIIQPNDEQERALFKSMPISVEIAGIRRFKKPVDILEVKERLSFITDKKNYGLFFRQATKVLSDHDFDLITSYNQQVTL